MYRARLLAAQAAEELRITCQLVFRQNEPPLRPGEAREIGMSELIDGRR